MTRITDILDDLDKLTREKDDTICVAEVKDSIGHRGSGVLVFLPGLIGMSPLGGIPGVPSLMAVIVLIFCLQIAIGKRALWLPSVLSRRSVNRDKLSSAVEKTRGVGKWIDRHFGGRLELLTGPWAIRFAALLCAALACTAPPLEVVPFAAAMPMAGIAVFGIAMTLKDGAAMLIAAILAAGALYGAFLLMP
ncbi:exopolysaccharide biosynthesis protein [Palleronia sp. LCG004]|uniref:exopolysaccharide biosynthesis protein n=1 Tax=Palleronia sp. LCG004 TaxID=3079304 RepID=UPI0029437E8A|nr:exopolysaccharide biosynthesis protein [Palleronia sp. LCG004]WOI56884.1 exopolysaccharide biosynthesis protein [Palleronia sp. LCG004]